ncbi:MAG: helix-turn-helix transcriptional regulator [Paraburkholderia tropica]|uniref:AraC-like DNA-binding protein n=1 Tax=Paraburkholderia tropica TaxID=92647 RepID=A0ABX5MLM9_9BURK|nr:helix-turn-helix transcriptional regulator [Paraburkholderia tropica]MBB3003494.1 AraC-like DNA-binding protein/quercetin dioxygenase-like cupin family protein [Paraburkholderia tropica]MBB6322596.1 AraC-like DNA-binding protein/quercetin dioxygenase-like cupin family protein [Paraburkholderia tropica]MDE1144086.1 helix-turn-helix transcriptional regulator [Paraburkholderia tropica]PXX11554.1 AraC-like DNA-binding protein [Paraburkholderia tropica]PZW76217.1 AraC-like DNA-binding protein [P
MRQPAERRLIQQLNHEPIVRPDRVLATHGPFLAAGELTQRTARTRAPHHHARGQLMGALNGLVSVGIDGAQWVVPAVHAIWIPPHHLHSVRSHGPFSGWSVFVAEARCAGLPDAPRAIRATPLLREAVRRAATWDDAAFDAARTRIAEMILDEIAAAPAEPLGLPRPVDARLARITDALAADPGNERSLEEWAAWGALAPRTLSRRFVAETGWTFAQWRRQARLLRALECIAEGRSVTATALELGYGNVSAFIEMFQRATGTTPGRYLETRENA